MAKYDVVLTDGPNDWLMPVDAGSQRDASTKAMQQQAGLGTIRGVTVKNIIKLDAPAKVAKPLAPATAAYIAGLA